MAKPLNVLFITADQWRGECLSALGHRIVKTPHLDALAGEGVLFRNHFANTAPCGPSRTTLHTGMYLQNHRSGTNGTPLDARHTNWAKEAARLGYDPVLFGYTDTSADPRATAPDDPWLRTYEGPLPGIRPVVMMGEQPSAWTDWLRAQGYPVPDDIRTAYGMRAPGPEYEDGAAVPRPLLYPASVDDTTFLVERCMDYLREAKGPFVAHLSILRPHPPFVAPEPYNALYDPMSVPGFVRRADAREESAQHPWLAFQLSRRLFRAPADEKKLRRMKAVYYGLMSLVDAAIGRVVACLKECGRWDDTLIVFTSDHGEQMGDHWLLGKCGYFDQSYRVPLIVRDPRHPGGRTVEAFTEHVDIMPTMLEAIGAAIPAQCDGRSLNPFLEGRAPLWRDAAHWEFDFRDVADDAAEKALGLSMDRCAINVIRDAQFKYVHFAGLPPLFFDLARDPGEFENLAGDPAWRDRVLDFAQRLLSWRMSHDERALTHVKLTEHGPIARP
jgi:arylsulfatase A-like enzyme